MSLQYYDINLAANATQKVAAQGRYIYYYSGTTPLILGGATPAAAGNQALKVQAGQSGNTILLMPGQSYRLDDNDKAPTEWILSNYKNAEVITGQVMVGEGDFRDSNTSNTNYLKLDATFANNVTVANTAGQAVPVAPQGVTTVTPQGGSMPVTVQNAQIEISNDVGNRIPVSLDPSQNLNTLAPVMAYTNSFTAAAIAAGSVVQVVSPAANTTGLIVEQVITDTTNGIGLLAKASVPANTTDGDVLARMLPSSLQYTTRQKVAAGKGLYVVNANGAASPATAYLLYTVL